VGAVFGCSESQASDAEESLYRGQDAKPRAG
jgi:hypothetical protein